MYTLPPHILDELGIASLPEDKQREAVESLLHESIKRSLTEITLALPEDKRDEFLALAEAGKQKELAAYARQYAPDLATLVKKHAEAVVAEFKAP